MQQRRKSLVLALCVLAAWFGWTTFARSAQETVTLHISGVRNADHFARVWVVSDRPYLWIRAEGPDRRWLQPLREKQSVILSHGGQRTRYAASVREDPEAQEYVDMLFREKYGAADVVRGLLLRRQTIPIRLAPL